MSRKATLKVRLQELVGDMVRKGIRLQEAHEQLERQFLSEVLLVCHGNQSRAAETLDVHRNTLRRKLRQHDLL
jgi:DNA-binding protein Fis